MGQDKYRLLTPFILPEDTLLLCIFGNIFYSTNKSG